MRATKVHSASKILGQIKDESPLELKVNTIDMTPKEFELHSPNKSNNSG